MQFKDAAYKILKEAPGLPEGYEITVGQRLYVVYILYLSAS